MGNKHKNKTPTRVEIYLQESYKYLDYDFSKKELITFNLKLGDAEKYFFTKFTFVFFYNTSFFAENFITLYDNFNHKVEKFCKENSNKLFNLFIEFDDESETISFKGKNEFESLFSIIFEKLEIHLIISFDLTSCKMPYISELISQLYENASLYKFNRQYDCVYCLLPNTDYFIKNASTFTYTSNKKQGIFYKENEEMLVLLFLQRFRKKYLQTKKDDPITYNYYEKAIEKIAPINCFVFTYVNNLIEEDNIMSLLGLLFLIIQNSSKVVFCILVNKKDPLPSIDNFNVIMERIISLCEKEDKLIEIAIKISFVLNDFSISQSYFNESIRIIKSKLFTRVVKCLKFSIHILQINNTKNNSREYSALKYTCSQSNNSTKKSDKMLILLVLKHKFKSVYKNRNEKNAIIINNIFSFLNNKKANVKEIQELNSGVTPKEEIKNNFIIKEHYLF